MLMSYTKVLLILMISMSVQGSEVINIYIGEEKLNLKNQSYIAEVIKCIFPKNKEVKLNYIPNNRTEFLLKSDEKNIVYPFASKDRKHDKYHFVGPVAIDEILLVSNTKKGNRSLGIVRGSLFYEFVQDNLKFNKYSKELYEVNNNESLIKGFLLDRVDSIVIKRVDLYKVSSKKDFSVQSLGFFETSVAISKRYNELVGGVKGRFSRCVADKKTSLSIKNKKVIVKAVKRILHGVSPAKLSKNLKLKIKATELDKNWNTNKEEVIKAKDSLLTNSVSNFLLDLQSKNQFLKEAFTFNEDGHTTAMTNETSNFDQSGEKKFHAVRNAKDLSVAHINDIGYDQSSNLFSISVTYPLYQKNKFEGGLHLVFEINGLIDYICRNLDKKCKIRNVIE